MVSNTQEMIAVVQAYIHHRKGVEVQVNPPRTPHEHFLLVTAYTDAIQWLNHNNGSISYQA